MRALLATTVDQASLNIHSHLVAAGGWAEQGSFDGHPVHRRGELALLLTDRPHLQHDGADRRIADALQERSETVIFLSKHRAESKIPTLTIHPIGNLGEAAYGGRSHTVVPTHPSLMTAALREVRRRAEGSAFQVSFEATHHGPYLETPTFFIEIGSEERYDTVPEAGRILAESLLAVVLKPHSVAIGIGGGHYVPRLTDVALSCQLDFGHMAATYGLEALESHPGLLDELIAKTPGARYVYLHRKAMGKDQLRRLTTACKDRGLEAVRREDLLSLEAS